MIKKKYLQKRIRKYVIATLDIPTFYLQHMGGKNWQFVDDIEIATKTMGKGLANQLKNLYYLDTGRRNEELVVVPVEISYDIVEDINEE